MEELTVSTESKLTVVDITDAVERALPADTTGTVTVFSQHTTAAITVNEAESNLLADFEDALADLIPDSGWQHDRLDGNADSHVRSLLLGPEVTIPVEDGNLQLGTWQSILLVECDGPRTRTVVVAPP
ncbi:secondary thiamine-phosphate synthase enzyme YjbQ [Halovenus marina]|uniref:secondary thiamine-phosphate synthase enzyme YjbQ n=1 Tax=Halovenus marina TaxID=3396621 RepID=UPI003F54662E